MYVLLPHLCETHQRECANHDAWRAHVGSAKDGELVLAADHVDVVGDEVDIVLDLEAGMTALPQCQATFACGRDVRKVLTVGDSVAHPWGA
jgi:hypothetical protein